MIISTQNLNISVSEFWGMPLFLLRRMSERLSSKEKEPSRKEYLVGYRERKKRLGWK